MIVSNFFTAPSSPPSNVTTYTLNSTAIAVFWSPPPLVHHNGIIREYMVEVYEMATGITLNLVVSGLSIVVTSLHPNYQYYIAVRALTIAYGPNSCTITIETLEDGKR